jgi:hypothetical protein
LISKDLLTTGEVARILKISRSTVSRNFDRGILTGETNPITGERRINRESVLDFIQEHKLPVHGSLIQKKQVLSGTSEKALAQLIKQTLAKDERIDLQLFPQGCDLLIACSKTPPDLLIIDDTLPDINFRDIIKSLAKLEDRQKIRILCLCHQQSLDDCEKMGIDKCLKVKELDRDKLLATADLMLGLSRHKKLHIETFEHSRKWPRFAVEIPTRVELYRTDQPSRRENGEAVIKNISLGGAFLSDIQMETGYIPGKPFQMELEVNDALLQGWKADCRVVRLQSGHVLSAGLSFVKPRGRDRDSIEALVKKQSSSF